MLQDAWKITKNQLPETGKKSNSAAKVQKIFDICKFLRKNLSKNAKIFPKLLHKDLLGQLLKTIQNNYDGYLVNPKTYDGFY